MMFQSTHPYRVRLPFPPSVSALLSFNPRTHTGCDFLVSEIIPNTSCFNPRTHTGCDEINQCAKRSVCKFQSTHPYRVRPEDIKRCIITLKFQSTHPYRVRRRDIIDFFLFVCFNPRTHTGCDDRKVKLVSKDELFQSTHPYRVRQHLSR